MGSEFMYDVHRQCCTRLWMEYLEVVDKIPHKLQKNNKSILSKIIRCAATETTYLFVVLYVKLIYLVKRLAHHRESFFPVTAVTGLKHA